MLQPLHEVDDGLRCARLALVALHVIGEAAHARRGMIVDAEMGGGGLRRACALLGVWLFISGFILLSTVVV